MMQSLAYHVSVLRKDFFNYCGEKLEEMELTPGRLYFLTYVARHPGCSPKELAQAGLCVLLFTQWKAGCLLM